MTNQNFFPLLLSSFIASFVVYKCITKKNDLIEQFGWNTTSPLTTKTELIGPDGNTVCGGEQKNLTYPTNPLVNPLFVSPQTVKEGIKDLQSGSKPQTQENYQPGSGNGMPFYTVNGTKDPYLTPRFDPNGVASYVNYDLPEQKNLANIASDPLTVAEYFEHGENKNGKKGSSSVGAPAPIIHTANSKDASSDNPLPASNTMENNGVPQNKDGFLINSERLMFSTAKSYLQGQGCPIRGDLPVTAVAPVCDTRSNIQFRPAAGATPQSSLRTGAIGVIAGAGGTSTFESTASLQSSAAGGVSTAGFGGVPFYPPEGSIGAQAYNVGMSNSISADAQSGTGPQGTITNTMNYITPPNPSLTV